jgi:polyphosphate kinase 2 (PPK2 family)
MMSKKQTHPDAGNGRPLPVISAQTGRVLDCNGAPVVMDITSEAQREKRPRIKRKVYNRALRQLHIELVKMQAWIRHAGMKVVIIFEGRDAAGKGGAIKRIVEPMNPRYARVVALGVPTEREKTQWYFQRYVPHLPAAGEIVLFDRSWYNRAGVERVMGFCTDAEYREFMRSCPEFERMLVLHRPPAAPDSLRGPDPRAPGTAAAPA